jgi:hypothetical protein
MSPRSEGNLAIVEDRSATLAWLQRAEIELAGAGAIYAPCAEAARSYRALARHLEPPPTIAIAGETNTGKSTLANALAQNELLPTSIFQATRIAKVLSHSDTASITAHATDGTAVPVPLDGASPTGKPLSHLEIGLPLERLKRIRIVDLPAVDLIEPDQIATLLRALRVDLTLYCTVATQAWKESERQAWQYLMNHRRRRGILVVTHADLIIESERRAVASRLRPLTSDLFDGMTFAGQGAGALTRTGETAESAPLSGDPLAVILTQVDVVDRRRARRVRDVARWISKRSRKAIDRELRASQDLIDQLSRI